MAIPLEAYLEVLPHHPVSRESDLAELRRGFQQATVRFEDRGILPWRQQLNFSIPRYAGLSLGVIDQVWGKLEGLLEEPYLAVKPKVEATYTPDSLVEMLRDAGVLESEVVTTHLSDSVSRITAWGHQEVDGNSYVNLPAASGLLERMNRALERSDSLARTYDLVPVDHPAHFRQLLLKVAGNIEVLEGRDHEYFRDLGYQLFIQDQPVNPFDHMVRSNQRGDSSKAYCEGVARALLERGNTQFATEYYRKAGYSDQEIADRLVVENQPDDQELTEEQRFDAQAVMYLGRGLREIYTQGGSVTVELSGGVDMVRAQLRRLNPSIEKEELEKRLARIEEGVFRIFKMINPTNFLIFVDSGVAAHHRGEDGKALKDFDRAVKLEPNGYTYALRASTLYVLGRTKEAEQNFGQAIEIDPDNPTVYHMRGSEFFNKAVVELLHTMAKTAEGLTLDDQDKAALSELKGRFEQCVADFTKVLELDNQGDHPDSEEFLGYSTENIGLIRKALS